MKVRRNNITKGKHGLSLSKEDFMKKYPSFKDNYEILGGWTTSQDKTLVKHKSCNKSWFTRPYNLAIGKVKCPYCEGGKTTLDTHYVSQLLLDTDFELISECKGQKDVVEFRHNLCGKTFHKSVGALLKRFSCPHCTVKSKGEDLISKYLSRNNINHKKEVTFKDLRGLKGGYLRYDFGLFDFNDNLKYFIEYDGEQHFIVDATNYFRDSLEKIQAHDRMKEEYCLKNNYKLLRIKYTDIDNIESVLNKFLSENMLIPSQAYEGQEK